MIRYLILSILLLVSVHFFAQEKPNHPNQGDRAAMFDQLPKEGVLSGQVIDFATNSPVQYANIVMYKLRDTSLVTGTIADDNGYFILEKLPYGRFIIEINFIGYEKNFINKVKIEPQQKQVDLGKIELKQASMLIDEVEVIGEHKHIEYKIDKKIVNVSQDLTSAGGTAADVLENTPSVETDIDGNVSLRGSSNFTVLIDGKPTVLSATDVLQQIPSSTIEQIEIITNPSAKYDPDGIAGIINVVLKKERSKGFNGMITGNIGMGPVYGGDILLNYRTGKLNFFVGGNYNIRGKYGESYSERHDYLTDTTYYITEGEPGRQRNGYSVKAGMEYDITKNNFMRFSANYGNRGFHHGSESRFHKYTKPVTTDLYQLQSSDGIHDNESITGDLYYQHNFKRKGHLISATGSYTRNFGNDVHDNLFTDTDENWNKLAGYPDNNRTSTNELSQDFIIKADYEKPIGKNGKLESGYQFRYHFGDADNKFEDFDQNLNKWVEDSSQHNSSEFHRNIQAVYTTFTNKIFGIEAMIGLRLEYTNRYIKSIATNEEYPIERFDYFPSIHLSKPFTKNFDLLASYSRRINRPREWYLDPFPNYSDAYTMRIGNPGLEPEYIGSYEIGSQLRIKKTSLSAEIYYRQTNNKITRIQTLRDDGVVVRTFDNLEKDYAIGIELSGNVFIKKWWQVNISGNMFNYHIEGEIIETDAIQATNSWKTRLSTNFKLKWGTKLQLTGVYNGPSITAQGERSDFWGIDAAISQSFMKRKLNINLRVRDIFGTMKREFTTVSDNLYKYDERRPQSAMIMLNITYSINNFQQKKRKDEGRDSESDGVDME